MVTLKPSALRLQAGEILQAIPYNPKKLMLFYTIFALGSPLVMSLLNYFFSLQIHETGGLSGIGLRTALTTAQSVLETMVTMAQPLWALGMSFVALCWARNTPTNRLGFLQGFRRAGSALGLYVLQGFVFFAVAMVIFNICTSIYMMTPFANPLLPLLEPFFQENATPEQIEALLTPEWIAETVKVITPLLVAFCLIFAAVAILFSYRLRFAEFILLEGSGPVRAMLKSIHITRKNCLQICKLDLSFWWFYLLLAASVAVSYGHILLSSFGVTLPISAEGSYFIFYTVGTVCQGLLFWQCQGRRLTTYALAYIAMDDKPTPPVEESHSAT